MKRFPVVILAFWVMLVAVVTGCGRAPRYDGRLVTADSLMRTDPDSALTIVEGTCRDSLATQGDRAYRDLLLTQARYRCYVTATSDSTINRALDYYTAHPDEREKLTRAHIYKGAVMEELGHPDSAMLHYKLAEAVADTTDYFNLGQINTRIGSLFRYHYADILKCYEKYKKAYGCYQCANDSSLMLNSLYNMGMCSGILGDPKSKRELETVSSMAFQLKDSSVYYNSQEMLVRQLIQEGSAIDRAKQTALQLMHDYGNYVTSDLLIDLAELYYKESKMDSAMWYLNIVKEAPDANLEANARIREHRMLADLAQINGDSKQSHSFSQKEKILTDSIHNSKLKYSIESIEEKFNTEIALLKEKEQSRKHLTGWYILAIALLAVSTFAIYQFRRVKTINSILRELKAQSAASHDTLIERLGEKQSSVVQLIENLLTFMHTAMDTSVKDSPKVIQKRIEESIQEIANENFWNELREFLDTNYNNIISNTAQNPKINNTDIKFIELMCCGFNYIEIAIVLGYSPNFVSNKRIRIANKLGIKSSLQEYLFEAMNGKNCPEQA